VLTPLHTEKALRLLRENMNSAEAELFFSLGERWTRSQESWHNQSEIEEYHPEFNSGWMAPPMKQGCSFGQKFLGCPTDGRAEAKIFWFVRPKAEPSRTCPTVRKVLGSDFGSAPEHFFGQFRTVGQPNSRESGDENHTFPIVID